MTSSHNVDPRETTAQDLAGQTDDQGGPVPSGARPDAEAREPQDTAAPGPAGGSAGDAGPGTPGSEAPEAPGAAGEGDPDPARLAADLDKTQRDVVELTADLQRLQAEYLNYKRRVDRDRELVRENATYTVVSKLLPVLDDIDRAREAGDVEGGFKVVADALERAVESLGLVRFGTPGDEFDPTLHEALMHGHSPDVETTTCQTIVQAGYRIGERVVRPARVTVVDPEPAGQ